MTVIYIISKYITVIGSVLKGFWEHLFCRILGLPVQDAQYLQLNELCGHVDHDFTKKPLTALLVCYLPGMMNRLFGYGLFIGSYIGLFILKVQSPKEIAFWFYVVMLYIGISLLCNNAPLTEDALNNWDMFYGKKSEVKVISKVLAFLPSVYFRVSAFMEKYCISLLIYAVAILVGLFVI